LPALGRKRSSKKRQRMQGSISVKSAIAIAAALGCGLLAAGAWSPSSALSPQSFGVEQPDSEITLARRGGGGGFARGGGRGFARAGAGHHTNLGARGVHRNFAPNRNVAHNRNVVRNRANVIRDGNIVRTAHNRNAVRNRANVIRDGNVIRTANVARRGWVRPGYRWRPGAAVAAGAALGFVSAATAAEWAGPPPSAGLCWYYTDAARTQGFWDVCP
jgi:hypothetical protein